MVNNENKVTHLLCITKYNPYCQSNATANRWRTITEGLQRRGFSISVFITSGYAGLSEFLKDGFSGTINGINYYHSAFLFNDKIWLRRINKYIFLKLIKNKQSRKLSFLIDKLDPKIVLVTSSELEVEIFCKTYNPDLHKFKVLHEVNEYPDLFFVPGTRSHNLYFNNFISKVDLLVCITEELINYFSQIPLKRNIRFHYMPVTVDLSRFQNVGSKYVQEKPYIAYCGGLNNDKDGIDILIYSFQRICREFEDINLLIAGPKEFDGEEILNLIKMLQLSHRIKYLGVLDRGDIPYLLCNAELLALPRPDSRQAKGGFPTKLGEYLASGRPVCVTRFGEISKYLKDEENAFLAESGSIDSFTDSLRRALTDGEKAEEVGKRGKEVAIRNFSMEIQASLLFDFIQKNLAE